MIAKKIIFMGQVQGVGFRFTSCEIAQKFKVYGWVKNLNDGNVELFAQGEKSELDSFIKAIYDSRLGKLVSGKADKIMDVISDLNNFKIKY